MRGAGSATFLRRRSLISPSHRRYARRASVSANCGTGGALLWTAELSAVRTESISGSSICAPAQAVFGSDRAVRAPAAALPNRQLRRERPPATLMPRACRR
ncbi:hypothetical protein D9M68_927410 [compost metagenome]